MNEKNLNQNKIYWIFSLRKGSSNNQNNILSILSSDKNVIYIEELDNLYKFVLEFESELHYKSQLSIYSKQNISLGFPSNENISSVDRVVEYLESVSDAQWRKIQNIKDKYSLVE